MLDGLHIHSSSWNPTVTAPESMANKTYTEVLDTIIQWTEEYRDEYQQKLRYDEHYAICSLAGQYMLMPDRIKYPNISREFVPVDECAARNLPGSGSKQISLQFPISIVASVLASAFVWLRN